jgi:PAS domain S-box-containing protein
LRRLKMNDRLANAVLKTTKRDANYRVHTRHIRKLQPSEMALEFRYRAMLEQIPAVIYTDAVGTTNQTIYINPQIEAITGYTPRQWTADPGLWFKIIHLDDQDRVWSEHLRTEESGEPFKLEYRISTHGGQEKWIYDEAWLIRDAQDKPLFWQGFMIDITARKTAEIELEQRARELSALQETVLDLTIQHSLTELLTQIVERAAGLLNAKGGALYLVEEETKSLRCGMSYHAGKDYAGSKLKFGEGAAGKVAKTGKPLNIKDYTSWPGKAEFPDGGELCYKALISAPMTWQGRVNGVLQVFREAAFEARDLAQLALFANHAAVAVENARLYESAALELSDRKRAEAVQQAIYRISQAVVTTASLEELFQSIHSTLAMLMPVENFYISMYDAESDLLSFPYYVDQYDQPPPPAKPDRGLTEYVIRTGQPLWATDEVFQQLINQGEVEVVGSDSIDWIGVPLKHEGQVVGVMVAQSYKDGVVYTQDDYELMVFVSTQVAVSIERKKAEDALRVSLEDTQRYAERAALLNRVAKAVSSTLDLDSLLKIVYQEIVNAVPADSFFLALYDQRTKQLEFRIRVDGDVNEPPYFRPLGNALTAQVVNGRKSLLIHDYEVEKNTLPRMTLWGTGQPSRSWLGVPVQMGEEVVGVISVQSYQPGVFGEHERELLATIADTVAASIVNARLYEEEKQRTSRLTQIVELGIELASLQHEEDVMDTLVKRVTEIMHSATCTILTIDFEKNEAVLAAGAGLPAGAIGTQIKLNLPAIRKLIDKGEPLIISDIDRQEPSIRQMLVRPDLKSFFAYPMIRNGRVTGVLTLSRLQTYQPSAEEISTCHLLAERAAAQLENARLFEMTERHLQQVQSLRTIDSAIASSFDLRSILNIILNQITTQLEVDAADVLLLNPHNYAFEFAAGKGFRTKAIEQSRFLLGEGVIGYQIMERRTVHIPNLEPVIHNFLRAELFTGEGFATYTAVPLVAKGEVKGVLEVYQRKLVERSTEWMEFLDTLAGQVTIAIDNSQLFANLQRSNLELSLAYDATIEGWSRALDMRDTVTEGHTKRVTEIALTLAKVMGMSESDLVHMRRGILLHDMGKMAIPDTILLKPDALSDDEWQVMHRHPQYAFDMLAPIAYLRPALDIPASHHEKWDGTGYPRGLKGEQIPLAARIFAVVDVFDALTSDRPYRKAWTKEKALQYIQDERGKSFDPRVVDVFMSLKKEMGINGDGG